MHIYIYIIVYDTYDIRECIYDDAAYMMMQHIYIYNYSYSTAYIYIYIHTEKNRYLADRNNEYVQHQTMTPWDLAYFCCHPGAGASPERWNDQDGVSEFLIHTVAVAVNFEIGISQ